MIDDLNFPLLKTFEVDSYITDFLNLKYEEYLQVNGLIPAENQIYISDTGGFTQNLLEWKDQEYLEFIQNDIHKIISNCLNLNPERFYFHYNHIFDYSKGGYVREHKHDHAEDYVCIFYLNTCDAGETVFFLNTYSESDKKRTSINIKPNKNSAVCFSSMLFHKANYTNEAKRIFVVGIKLLIN